MNEININTETTTSTPEVPEFNMGKAYVELIKALETFAENPLPTPLNPNDEVKNAVTAAGSLAESGWRGVNLIDAIATFGAAMDATLDAVLTRVPAKTFPELEALHIIRKQLQSTYHQELAFCRSMEQMHRNRILIGAGVDPKDPAAVTAFFNKAGSVFAFTAPEQVQQN